MSSRGRSRGRGYFGRGGGAPYRQRDEHPSHRGVEEHHSSSQYRGGSHFSPRGGSAGEYSSRHHKEIMSGGPPPHHSSREHHSSGRGEERYHHRRGGNSDRSGYDHREHHSSSRRSPPPPPPSHHRRPSPSLAPMKRHEHVPLRRHEQILSKLAPEEQYALTKALVATVLQESEGREGRGYREERGVRDDRERGYRDESSGRDFRERRPPPFAGPSSRYQSRGGFREDRGRGFYRGRGFRGAPRGARYESGLQQRLSIPYRGGHDTGYRRKYADYEQSDQPYKRQRLNSEGDAANASTGDRIESRVSRDDVDTDDDEAAEADGVVTEVKKAEGDVDTDEEVGTEGSKKTAITVEASTEGERAPWREGDRSGRLFVELQCPHCPAQCSITLKEYKYHLSSVQHLSNMNRLAYKHSQLLMRIRKQQRHKLKQLEDEYLTEHPDQAEVSVSRFCGTCKLNYRCLGGDIKEGLAVHCKTRLHKMQHNYLHPRCLVCRQKGEVATRFKSRMVYEHHVASITHMKNKMDKLEMFPDDLAEEDAGDLDGFMTVDSVGEDEEAGLEEHDEITGDAEAQELAKKAAEAGADDVEDDGPEVDDGTYEPIGMAFVQARKVYFCQLCLLGLKDSGVKRHCSTPTHRAKYFAAKKKAAAAKEAAALSRRQSSDFPRSGGRAEDRDEEDDEEDDDAAVKKESVGEETKEGEPEKGDQKNVTRNGNKTAVKKGTDYIDDDDDKDDSEKDYEEYNEKYEYTDPNHEDYEEEAPDDDELWDEMDRDLTDAGDEIVEGKAATNGDDVSSPVSSPKKSSPSAAASKVSDKDKVGGDNTGEGEVDKTSPKLKRRLRSAAKKEDTDEEEIAEEEMEAEEKDAEEENMDENQLVAGDVIEDKDDDAAPLDVNSDDE